MSSSLRLTPAPSHTSQTTHITTSHSAPSAPGVHDNLRASLNTTSSIDTSNKDNSSAITSSNHPLEHRLQNWPSTQRNLHHTLLRRQFGLATPLHRDLELLTVRNGDGARPSCLDSVYGYGHGSAIGDGLGSMYGMGSVHEEILRGRDWEVGWDDVFLGGEGAWVREMGGGFHGEMETRMGMQW